MAKLVTVVRTFFGDGTYRNNRVEMQIPDEAAEIIKAAWTSQGYLRQSTAIQAMYLASNQNADALLYAESDNEPDAGVTGMSQTETDENEVFSHSFKDDEED